MIKLANCSCSGESWFVETEPLQRGQADKCPLLSIWESVKLGILLTRIFCWLKQTQSDYSLMSPKSMWGLPCPLSFSLSASRNGVVLGAMWSWPAGGAQICAEVTTFKRFGSFLPAFSGNQRVGKVLGQYFSWLERLPVFGGEDGAGWNCVETLTEPLFLL